MQDEFEVVEVLFVERVEEIRAVRFSVFVDEQGVPPEIEMDDWDERSRHVLATRECAVVGTGRLLPDGHIGRVAVLARWRGFGVGLLLMRRLMEMGEAAQMSRFVLSAQTQAVPFYERLGFVTAGEIYLEAGIEHIEMIKEQ